MLSPGGWDAMRALTLMIEQIFYSSRGQVGQIFEFGITGDIWDNEYVSVAGKISDLIHTLAVLG